MILSILCFTLAILSESIISEKIYQYDHPCLYLLSDDDISSEDEENKKEDNNTNNNVKENNDMYDSGDLGKDVNISLKTGESSNNSENEINKIVEDKDVELKAMIETLIARGELQRSAYNQNITSAEGSLIGSNLKEAVAWFKDPANTGAVTAYANKLANI